MLDKKSILTLLKDFIYDVKYRKEETKRKNNKLYYTYINFYSMLTASTIVSNMLFWGFKGKGDYFVVTTIIIFILFCFPIKKMFGNFLQNKLDKFPIIDDEGLISDFLEKNELEIILNIHQSILQNSSPPLHPTIVTQFEVIKFQFANKNWKFLMIELPKLLNMLDLSSKDKMTDQKKIEINKKLKHYNSLLNDTINIKEKEINYNL